MDYQQIARKRREYSTTQKISLPSVALQVGFTCFSLTFVLVSYYLGCQRFSCAVIGSGRSLSGRSIRPPADPSDPSGAQESNSGIQGSVLQARPSFSLPLMARSFLAPRANQPAIVGRRFWRIHHYVLILFFNSVVSYPVLPDVDPEWSSFLLS